MTCRVQDWQSVPLRKGLCFFFNSIRKKENLLNYGGVLARHITEEEGLGQADRAASLTVAMGDAIACTLAQAGKDVGSRNSAHRDRSGSQHSIPGMKFAN